MANGSGVCSYPGDISMIDIADRFRHGGQAFPSERWEGMSLRDWFAGQVLLAFLTRTEDDLPDLYRIVSRRSYAMADAMLAERIKDE